MQLPRRVCALLAAGLTSVVGLTMLPTAPAHAGTWRIPAPDSSVNPANHPDEYGNRVMDRVNKRRARAGLSRIRVYESCLDGMAERWARNLAEWGTLRHRNQRRVLDACDLHWTGETIAKGSRSSLSPGELVTAWMHSPDHRAILMKPRANRAGIGIRFDSRGNLYAVVNLGDPT
jgi:uncharacterized protein YkwD